jgi:hypothetical protein
MMPQTDDQMRAAIASWLTHDDEREAGPFDDEERKERDWHYLESEAREFVQRYGAAAMLRCVSEALR